ncbi:MAG: ABC transporter ATP-binding protein [Thermoplasmata archaeon]|nr:ABC transporter ATP-binding protein [Thermoplasmata archaeon]
MADDAPVLRISGLVKDFDGFRALNGIDLEFGKGLMVGLIGPNGCGKSTMMKCISRIHPQTEGTIEVDGKDISAMKASEVAKIVANVPAEAGQTFGISVMDMVMLGRYPFVDRIWWENPEDERITREALRTFGIDHLRRKQVALCSSGERQRALIAKAYVQEPKLMLVDEPTSHLDIKYKLQVMEYLQKMARSDMTVVVAEHDISLMARYCDVCVIMKRGEVVAVGDPRTIITEQLIKRVYEVEARVGFDADGEVYMLPKRCLEDCVRGHRLHPSDPGRDALPVPAVSSPFSTPEHLPNGKKMYLLGQVEALDE